MLRIDLILKLKKKTNLNIGECKNILILNNWSYEKCIFYIKNKQMKKCLKFKFFSILTLKNKNGILIIKIMYNSEIIKDSSILDNFSDQINNNKNFYFIKDKINILSLKLKEYILLKNVFFFNYKNNYFYNHKNFKFCLINFKKNILNICCDIIFNKINYIKYNFCKNSLFNQKYLKNNELINKLINVKLINYIFLLKNNVQFYYE